MYEFKIKAMAEYKLLLPSMGEGVMEATIISWLCNEGDFVKEDDSVVEIATDKVDSDVPTPVSGKIIKILKHKDEIAKVGEPVALIEIEGENAEIPTLENSPEQNTTQEKIQNTENEIISELEKPLQTISSADFSGDLYLSPLVKSVALQENISDTELKAIKGNGLDGRITKEDILEYVKNRTQNNTLTKAPVSISQQPIVSKISVSEGDEIIPMDRVRKLIADAMVNSKKVSPHVTSFIETDVTNIVKWRNKHKDIFEKREGEKLTFMPIFVKAVVKAIQDFPLINISVDGDKIIKKEILISEWQLLYQTEI